MTRLRHEVVHLFLLAQGQPVMLAPAWSGRRTASTRVISANNIHLLRYQSCSRIACAH